jgi:hypothetical protein
MESTHLFHPLEMAPVHLDIWLLFPGKTLPVNKVHVPCLLEGKNFQSMRYLYLAGCNETFPVKEVHVLYLAGWK